MFKRRTISTHKCVDQQFCSITERACFKSCKKILHLKSEDIASFTREILLDYQKSTFKTR